MKGSPPTAAFSIPHKPINITQYNPYSRIIH